MDRRTFLRTAGTAGAGLVLGAFPSGLVRAESRPGSDLAFLPLDKLSRLMRRGEITSLALVELYLDRIGREEGPDGLNAYITVAGEQALRQARALDRLVAQGRFLGPLHGLPIAVKDNLDTLDMPTTGGTSFLAGWRPKRDAFVVDKLRRAGAVIIGKTNMHELAMGVTTNNPHYGPTRNPHNRGLIPGGSSGGSAAGRGRGTLRRGPWARTPAARCASRRPCAAWWGSNPPWPGGQKRPHVSFLHLRRRWAHYPNRGGGRPCFWRPWPEGRTRETRKAPRGLCPAIRPASRGTCGANASACPANRFTGPAPGYGTRGGGGPAAHPGPGRRAPGGGPFRTWIWRAKPPGHRRGNPAIS